MQTATPSSFEISTQVPGTQRRALPRLRRWIICAVVALACVPLLMAEAPGRGYGNLPVWFEPNVGQTRDAQFVAYGHRMNARFQRAEMELTLQTVNAAEPNLNPHVVRFKFVGALPGTIIGMEPQAGISNYIKGNTPANWRTRVPHYSRLRYSRLFPGIDLAVYGSEGSIEHDYIVQPGADPGNIRVQVDGATALSLSADGALVLKIPNGELTLRKPVAYQLTAESRTPVEARYKLSGSNLSFELGAYDRTRELVIDPILSYSTYVAGTRGEYAQAIAVDDLGSAYITGLTFSSDFPSKNAVQATCSSCPNAPDVYVTKLNATGTDVVYSTFLGGSAYDEPRGIAVDSQGNAVVVGYTRSTDFPLKSEHTPLPAGSNNTHGFVTSLAPDGSSFNYSSYVGGRGGDTASSVAVDTNGNSYTVGLTDSPDFPVTAGTFNSPAPAYPNSLVYIQKVSPTGALLISGIIPPAGPPTTAWANSFAPRGIALDPSGNIYIAGASSDGWPTTPGSFQPNYASDLNSQSTDTFVTKINPAVSTFIYSTYIGGNSSDDGKALAVDTQGNAYVVGHTSSTNFPVTAGSFLTSLPNGICCTGFLAKLNSTGSALAYSTYIAGSNIPFGAELDLFSVAVDGAGKAHATGLIRHMNFPLVSPIQSTAVPDSNTALAFVMNAQGSALTFSTYLSGTTGAIGLGAAVDKNGALYLTGTSYDIDFPTTAGAFQRSVATPPPYTSASHAFVSKIDLTGSSPGVCFSSGNLVFPDTPVGQSYSKTVTLTNCGEVTLHIASITTAAPYSLTKTCLSTLTPASSCSITVKFTPVVAGIFTGAITIDDDAPTTPQKVLLNGVGAVPNMQLSGPGPFIDTPVGVTTFPLLAFIHNAGNAPLTFSSISVTGDFAQENDCTIVQQNANCAVFVRFTPTAVGARTGKLTLVHNASGSPTVVDLQGNGISAYPTPVLNSISKRAVLKGSAQVALMAFGGNLFPTSVIRVNGVELPTTSNTAAQLSATIPASQFTEMRELWIDVVNPGSAPSSAMSLVVYDRLAIAAPAIVYDKFSRRVLAAVPSPTDPNSSTLQIIDPITAAKTSVSLGKGANRLAISDDGRFAYVGLAGENAVQRVDLETNTADIKVPMPPGELGAQTAYYIQPLPGLSTSFAVSLLRLGSPSEGGLAVFDDATSRGYLPNAYPAYTAVGAIGFAGNPSSLYGVGNGKVWNFTLSPTPSTTGSVQSPLVRFTSDGTYLYDVSGRVYDPVNNTLLGTYTNPQLHFSADVLPRTDQRRTFVLEDQGNSKVVHSYDQQTFSEVGEVVIDGQYSSAAQVVRWGADAFAFNLYNYYFDGDHTNDGIILFRSSIASVDQGTNPLPSVVSVSPNVKPAVVHNLILTITGANFVRGSVVRWNGTALETSYVSDTALKAYVSRADLLVTGAKKITVFNPPAGGGESGAVYFDLNGPAAVVSPQSLDFGKQSLNTIGSRTVTLTNSGTGNLSISSIGGLSGAFSQTNDCGTSLAPGAACTITVAFKPTSGGWQTGTLSISDNGPDALHTAAIAGTGDAPITVTLSRNSIDFGYQMVGEISAAQSFTMTAGNSFVKIASVNVGTSFQQSNDCGALLAPGSSCTFQVKFAPTQASAQSGTLNINSDAQGGPHNVSLAGKGTDFTVSATGSGTVTVSRGQPATYTLSLAGGEGFSGTAAMSCSNLPAYATCAFSPNSVSLAQASQSVALTISTKAAGSVTASNQSSFSFGWLALLVPAIVCSSGISNRKRVVMLIVLVCSTICFNACGGGGGTSGGPGGNTSQVTAPGTYTISVDAKVGTVVRSRSITLVVQ